MIFLLPVEQVYVLRTWLLPPLPFGMPTHLIYNTD